MAVREAIERGADVHIQAVLFFMVDMLRVIAVSLDSYWTADGVLIAKQGTTITPLRHLI